MPLPAPLPIIREKLASTTPSVRVVALLHAAAHGRAAQVLAAEVARMLEDESPAVQFEAIRAFKAIGVGATNAVPILSEQLQKRTPSMLISRALAALSIVGEADNYSLDLVLAIWKNESDPHVRSGALATLAKVAGDNTAVQEIVFDALFSNKRDDFSIREAAASFLPSAPPAFVDRVLEKLRVDASRADASIAEVAPGILRALAPSHQEQVEDLLGILLTRNDAPWIANVLNAIKKLPRPMSTTTLNGVLRVAATDGLQAQSALDLLTAMGTDASFARSVFVAQLATNAHAIPYKGRRGESSSTFCTAAKALATCCPDAKEDVPTLLWWLDRALSADWDEATPNTYTLGRVLGAACTLDATSERVHRSVLAVAAASRAWIDEDESGVRDLDNTIRRSLTTLEDSAILWSKLEAIGLRRVDDESAASEQTQKYGEEQVPEFPPESPPPPPLTVAPLSKGQLEALADALALGETTAGISTDAAPRAIAKAVDVAIRRACRDRRALSDDELIGLASLWGQAISKAAGWSWMSVGQYEKRSTTGLVSPTRAHICLPFEYIRRQADPRNENTVLLLFNGIAAGQLESPEPGALRVVA